MTTNSLIRKINNKKNENRIEYSKTLVYTKQTIFKNVNESNAEKHVDRYNRLIVCRALSVFRSLSFYQMSYLRACIRFLITTAAV